MASTFWDPHGEARAALHAIASDPQYGVAALSSPQILAPLLKDYLPDAPREASVLMAAAEARLAALLQDYTRQGMDPRNAAHLVRAFFASRTALTPDACDWAVGELMIALGINLHGLSQSTSPAAPQWSAVLPPPPPSAPPPAPVGAAPPPPMAPPPPAAPRPAEAPPLPAAALYGPPTMAAPGAPARASGEGTFGMGHQFPPPVPTEYLPGQRRPQNLGWIMVAGAVVVVVVVVAVLVLNKPGTPIALADAQRQATSVPASVLNAIGPGSAYSNDVRSINGTPMILDLKAEVLYIGADFCPFCAADQWSLIVALSRFGRFSGLRPTASATQGEPYPGTATLGFYKATYSSDWISFVHIDSQTTAKTTLQVPTAREYVLWQRYDTHKNWPFLDIANEYKSTFGYYDLNVLHGKNQEQIAAALHDPNSPIAKAVDGAANMVTAALCIATLDQPASACNSKVIRSLQHQL